MTLTRMESTFSAAGSGFTAARNAGVLRAPDELAGTRPLQGPTAPANQHLTAALCHLAYVSQPFRRAAIGLLSRRSQMPIQLEPSVDFSAVLRACASAESIESKSVDRATTAFGIIAALSIIGYPLGTAGFVVALVGWLIMGTLGRRYSPRSPFARPAEGVVLGGIFSLVGISLVAAGYLKVGWRAVVPVPLFIGLLVTAIISVKEARRLARPELIEAAKSGPPMQVEPDIDPKLHDGIAWATHARGANLDLFASYEPFEFSVDRSRSSVQTVDLTRPMIHHLAIRPISIEDTYQEMLRHLGSTPMRGLRVQEVAYAPTYRVSEIDGLAMGPGHRILPRLPTKTIHEAERLEIGVIRPYVRLTVDGPGGMPMIAAYVRAAIDGQTMFVEVHHATGAWLRWDLLHRASQRAAAGEMGGFAWRVADLPADILKRVLKRRDIAPFTFAGESVTSLIPNGGPPTYFDELDARQAREILHRRVQGTIEKVLEDANVDTSEFSSRSAIILNNFGVMANGTITNSAFAFGKAASAEAKG